MLCTECGSPMRKTSEPIEEEYKGINITVVGVEHYACDACGEYELGPEAADELAKQLIEGYAHARGLLTPTEIRGARKQLGMTQSEFESALGVSAPTASRWETGVMSPSKSVCKLIRMFVDNPSLARDDTRLVNCTYKPKAPRSAIPQSWRVYQGGVQGHSSELYDPSLTKLHSFTSHREAKEG